MNAMVRRKLEMAVRVRDFIRAHPWDGASYAGSIAGLEELLKRAEELAAQQRAGLIEASAAVARRLELKRVMQFKLLRHLVRVGMVAGKDRTDLAKEFRLPLGRSAHRSYLTAAKGMLAKAEMERELLVSKGLSETLLDDLGKAVSEFEATVEKSSAGRREHVGARADLQVVTGEILSVVKFLDGLVRYRFGSDPELMAAWDSARNVFGPFKGKGTPPEPSGGSVAPAA